MELLFDGEKGYHITRANESDVSRSAYPYLGPSLSRDGFACSDKERSSRSGPALRPVLRTWKPFLHEIFPGPNLGLGFNQVATSDRPQKGSPGGKVETVCCTTQERASRAD